MSLFGRKPHIYASDTSSHKPVGLFICIDCGATVTEPNKEIHAVWHTTLEERLTALETRPVAQPININYPGQTTPTWTPTIYPNTWPTYPQITYTSGNIATSNSPTGTGNYSTGFTANTSSGGYTLNIPDNTTNKEDNHNCDPDCDCGGACE